MSKFTKPPDIVKFRFNINKKLTDSYISNSISEPYYGRVDSDKNIISLSEHNLKQISTINGGTYWALNFVVDAFEEFRRHYNRVLGTGRRGNKGEIPSIEPTKAWTSGNQQYHDYMQTIYTNFFGSYIKNDNRITNLLSFKDFLHIFTQYVNKIGPKVPLTKSAYIMSNLFDPYSTGLMIDIKEWGSFSMEAKEKFMNDPNFDFYVKTAKKFGFKVEKRAPWRLVADLSSRKMLKYANASSLDNAGHVFEENFFNMYQYDIDILKSYLKRFYDTFMTAYPWIIKVNPKNCNAAQSIPNNSNWLNSKLITHQKQKFRSALSNEEYHRRFGTLFWMKYYLFVRSKEVSAPWSKKVLRKKYNKAIELYKELDIDVAMRYINTQIRNVDEKRSKIITSMPVAIGGKYVKDTAQAQLANNTASSTKQKFTNIVGDY